MYAELTERVGHKFDSPMTVLLWELSLDSGQDDDTGDMESGVWCAQFGRRLLFEDSQGFVWHKRYETEDQARAEFECIAAEYYDGLVE